MIYIHGLAEEYHIPYDLVKSVIYTESSWNHKAVSTSGAIGLMQILPSTAMDEFKTPKSDLYDPYVNVTVGIMYLSELYHNSDNDWHYALTSLVTARLLQKNIVQVMFTITFTLIKLVDILI